MTGFFLAIAFVSLVAIISATWAYFDEKKKKYIHEL